MNMNHLIRWKSLSLKTFFVLATLVGTLPSLQGEEKGRGLRQPSQETIDHVEQHWPFIAKARPNKICAQRLAGNKKMGSVAQTHAEEFQVATGKNSFTAQAQATPLPSSVDNSKLPSFPPIGDQQQLGSCVAFGSTYYQGTHEYGLLNGINNKTDLSHVFSPKWTYNLLNGGQDGGLDIFSTYQLFAQNGYTSWLNLPYDTNYRAWDLNPQDWVTALNFRTKPAQMVAGLDGNLQTIKQLLSNGHVLTFGTYVDSWVYDHVKADPAAPSNPHAGELAATWMNGYYGGHCMTIVGYDDNIWLDINKNGVVDPGEKGAFLIANSWGTGWGNKGFVWVAYDAFLSQSAVPNGPKAGRIALGAAMNSNVVSVVPLNPNYTPKLIAQFTLSHIERDQISISAGISATNATTPLQTINSFALGNQGGNFEFDGTAPRNLESATFALDLTDLLTSVSDANQRFYLIIKDNQKGNPTTLQSFTLIDNVHKTQVNCLQTPVICDNSQNSVYIDYNITNGSQPSPAPTPPAPTLPPTLAITAPLNQQLVSGNVWLVAKATDATGIARVDFFLDGHLLSSDQTNPYQVLLKTGKLSKGSHTITATAYNTKGLKSTQKITIRKR